MSDAIWLKGSKIFFLGSFPQGGGALEVRRGTIESYDRIYQFYWVRADHDDIDRSRGCFKVDADFVYTSEKKAITELKAQHKHLIEKHKKEIKKRLENINLIQQNTPGDNDE